MQLLHSRIRPGLVVDAAPADVPNPRLPRNGTARSPKVRPSLVSLTVPAGISGTTKFIVSRIRNRPQTRSQCRKAHVMTQTFGRAEDTEPGYKTKQIFYRFHVPYVHLSSVFGDDWFALKAEAFARFFGTPTFLISQTVIVAAWILVNVLGFTTFDIYPFILLNLAFSLQAAYAAPLILLAQTRQADRDKAHSIADAEHRDALHRASEERAALAAEQTALLVSLVQQNTELTATIKSLTEHVQVLTVELHDRLLDSK